MLEMQQWDFDIVHKKVVYDLWYAKRIEEIGERQEKLASWRVEDGLLYKYT